MPQVWAISIQVVPVVTPPVSIQLEAVPVKVKLVKVAVCPFPVASAKEVSLGLVCPANP